MAYRYGAIVWRETMTPDLDRTTAFYTELFGWKTRDTDMGPQGIYRVFSANGKDVAGSMKIPANMPNIPPHWMQHVSVPDVDAAVGRVKANNGKVLMGPHDAPAVGKWAITQDPQGGVISLFHAATTDGEPSMPPVVGTFCWESLGTTDKKAAVAYYTAVVDNWKASEFQGMITLGTGSDMSEGVADVGDAPPGVPTSWLSHVVVANLAESRERATRLGAKVMMPEIAIPNIGKICVIADPVGAVISLFESAPRSA